MVLYQCNKCKKVFNRKSHYDYHVYKRKFPCLQEGIIVESKDDSFSNPNNKKVNLYSDKKEPKFFCSNCDITFATKSNLNRHNKRFHESENKDLEKNLSIFNNLQTAETQTNVTVQDSTIQQPILLEPPTNSTNTNILKTPQSEHDRTQDPKSDTRCNYCFSTFATKSSLNRHIDKYCKVKKQVEQEKQEIFNKLIEQLQKQNHHMEQQAEQMKAIKEQNKEIREQNKKHQKEIKTLKSELGKISISAKNVNSHNKTTTKTTNNTQINNNIKLVAFGQEDLSGIEEDYTKAILKKGFQSVPTLTKYVHFNKNKPEHHNVYIPNMRDKHAMVFTGHEWDLTGKNEIINQIYDDKKQYLDEQYDNLFESLDGITKKKYKKYQNQEKDAIKRIKSDLNLLLYNRKNVPMETKKMLEGRK